jgi:hypothetical protein
VRTAWDIDTRLLDETSRRGAATAYGGAVSALQAGVREVEAGEREVIATILRRLRLDEPLGHFARRCDGEQSHWVGGECSVMMMMLMITMMTMTMMWRHHEPVSAFKNHT